MNGSFSAPVITVSRLAPSTKNLTEVLENDICEAFVTAQSAGRVTAQIDPAVQLGLTLFDLSSCLSATSKTEFIDGANFLKGEDLLRWKKKTDPRLATEFLIQRLVLYSTLGSVLGCRAHEIELAITKNGKPFLPHSALDFSISHTQTSTESFLAVGWVHGSAELRPSIGVDIEVVKAGTQVDRLAARFFSNFENERLRRLGPSDRVESFFKLWSAKESIVKALATGMFEHMGEVELDFFSGDVSGGVTGDVAGDNPGVVPVEVSAAAAAAVANQLVIRRLPLEAGPIGKWRVGNCWDEFLSARQMLGAVAVRLS